jgi:hypothetical protein
VSSAMELMTVQANLVPVGASWRVLCSYRSSFEGGGVVVQPPPAGRFEGAVNGVFVHGTVAVMVTSRPRARQQCRGYRHSARCGAAGAGMVAQG